MAVDGVRQVLEDQLAAGAIVGAVAAVDVAGETAVEIVGERAVGGAPMTRDTVFRISSMTKPVVAVAALILIEDGRLQLDEPVDRLLPELANRRVLARIEAPLDETVAAERPITVRDLLTFTMGFGLVFAAPGTYPIQDAIARLDLGQGAPGTGDTPPPDEWTRQLGTLPLMYQPGDRWLYNTGSDVLGVLIARAAGAPLSTFLEDRIFQPLGMGDTGFSVEPANIERLATSYWPDAATGRLAVHDDPRTGRWSRPPAFPSGGGGLVSTIDDFLAFAGMLRAGGSVRGARILTPWSVAAMTCDQLTAGQKSHGGLGPGFFDDGGWGFGVRVADGGAYGWDGGLGTSWWNDPARGAIAILLTQTAWTSAGPPAVASAFRAAVDEGR